MRADRQADRLTNTLITILRTLIGCEVISDLFYTAPDGSVQFVNRHRL